MKQNYPLLFIIILYAITAPAQSTWTVVPSPNFGEKSTFLRGISGTSDTNIWTVGNYEVPQPGGMIYSENLVLHFNGTDWTRFSVPVPDAVSPSMVLWDVETTSAEDIWAVGDYHLAEANVQILHYDGSSWEQHQPDLRGSLYAIDAITPTDIWAVGRKGEEPVPNPALAMHFNGSSWTEIPVPIVGLRYQALRAVDGIANDDVWAVGWWAHSRGSFMAMAMHWDGTSWNNSELPASIMESFGELQWVSMIASNDVWASGTDLVTGEGILIHWDGTTWSEVTNPGGIGAFAGLSSNNIISVGQDIFHWDGESWRIIDDLNFSSYPTLTATTILPSGEIWAAGTTMHEGDDELNPIFNTLVMRSKDVEEVPVELPPDNFSIKMKDESCNNMNNGQVVIEAKEEHNYVVELNNESTVFAQTKTISFEQLAPNTYYLGIMVEGEEQTKRSFEFEIKPGMTFDAQMHLISSANSKELQVEVLEGTAPFKVRINGQNSREFHTNRFFIPVEKNDFVEIKSSLDCEGSLEMDIDFGGKATLYSNPVTTVAQVHLPALITEPLLVEVYNNMGQRILSTYHSVQEKDKLNVDLSKFSPGVYYAKLHFEKPQTIKIIKR